jgi:hypothetical protein
MHQFLQRLAARLPKREIRGDNGEPYLNRYALLVLGDEKNPWFSLYLHHFVASDPDRGLHDHPWSWGASLVLTGGYLEALDDRRARARRPGAFTVFGPSHRHRVIICKNTAPVWTLFAHGKRVQGWSFYRLNFDGGEYQYLIRRIMSLSADDNTHAGWWKRKST